MSPTPPEVSGDGARHLGGAVWPELEALDPPPLLVVPLGSLEQHGPHLPLDTDTRIAVAIAEAFVAGRPAGDSVVGPPVAYGSSGEHAAFAATLSIGHDALAAVLVELARSADGFAGVVFVNGHGGNAPALASAVEVGLAEGRRVLGWSWSVPGGDAHAGRTETSLLLAIAPQVVRLDLAEPGVTEPMAVLLPRLRADGVRAVSANGVLGDPTGASAEEGRDLLAQCVADLAAAVAASRR